MIENSSRATRLIAQCAEASVDGWTAWITVGEECIEVRAAPAVARSHLAALASLTDGMPPAPMTDRRVVYVAAADALPTTRPPAAPTTLRPQRYDDGSGDGWSVAVDGVGYAVSADRRTAAVLYRGPEIPAWEQVRPLLPAIQGLLGGTGWTVIHGAAVGTDDQAVLVTGPSGGGKSSLALAAIAAGWQYFGDDVVAVSTHPAPRVTRIYNSARLRLPPAPGLEAFASMGTFSTDDGEPRRELDVSRWTGSTPTTADIVCVAHAQRTGAPGAGLHPVSRAKVIATTTATTLIVCFGGDDHVEATAQLCAQLPLSGFDSGPSPVTALAALAEYVDRHRHRSRDGQDMTDGGDDGVPTVAVVVAAWNAGRTIELALRSIVEQVPAPNEVIVVDDGSSDDTAARASSVPGVRVIRLQRNGGVAAALNTGIGASSSDVLMFLDADDVWAPGVVRRAVEALRADHQLDGVSGSSAQFDDHDDLVRVDQIAAAAGSRVAAICKSSLAIRRAAFDRVGEFDPRFDRTDFIEWMSRPSARLLRIGRHDEVVHYRRLHPDNMGRVHTAEQRAQYLDVMRRAIRERRGGS